MEANQLPPRRRWLILPPIVIAVAIVAWLVSRTPEPQREAPREAARVLRVIEAPLLDVIPRVTSYGTARPAQTWRAVAEVEGRVVEVHRELKSGAFLKADEIVLKIDPRQYELAVSQLESEIRQIDAQVAELTTQEENDRASLAIEDASLQLAQADFQRVRELVDQGASSSAELRDEERTYLMQKQKVQSLQNALNLVPRQRAALEAALAVKKTRQDQAQLDLAKTVIRAPIECRLGDVHIETSQYLRTGETLFEADGVDATEIDVQVSIDRAMTLLQTLPREQLGGIPDMERVREWFGFKAIARVRIGEFHADWPARFVRIREQIDPVTRTAAFVVAVDQPYARAIPGQRPPLVRGTFCEVELQGRPLTGRVVIPRAARHNETVYVIGADNRLQRRAVQIAFGQDDFLCLDGGIEPDERVVVSDPTPAIEGMLVEPVSDESLRRELIAQATGGDDAE